MKFIYHLSRTYTHKLTVSLLSLFLALTSAVYLVSANGKNKNFDGIYMGVAAGGLDTWADLKTQEQGSLAGSEFKPIGGEVDLFNNPDGDAGSTHAHKSSGIGALRLGYGKSVSENFPVWLGLEIFGNFADREAEDNTVATANLSTQDTTGDIATANTNVTTTSQARLNDAEFGIDLRPGLLLTNTTLLYARVGAAFNELKLDVDSTMTSQLQSFLGNTGTATVNADADDSDSVVGLRLGLGLEQKLTPSFSITADYIYTDYGSIDAQGSNSNQITGTGDLTGIASFSTSSKAEVQTQSVLLGFNYYPMVKKRSNINMDK